jgi:hypothetical protein
MGMPDDVLEEAPELLETSAGEDGVTNAREEGMPVVARGVETPEPEMGCRRQVGWNSWRRPRHTQEPQEWPGLVIP